MQSSNPRKAGLVLAITSLSLAGCGDNVLDRTLSGGLIGAGGGGAIGLAVGNPAAGVLVGGVAGWAGWRARSPVR